MRQDQMIEVLLPKCAEQENCDAVCLEYETGSRNIRMEIMEYTDTDCKDRDGDGKFRIGIVRISGENAVEIAEKGFRARERRSLGSCESHTIHYGYVFMMEMRRSMRSF